VTVISRTTADHYTWGALCEGWRHLDRRDLSVIEERIPPGAGEVRHVHRAARQLFFVLNGALTIEKAGATFVLNAGESLEVEPGVPHHVRNGSDADVDFLVVSTPSTRDDRTNLP
jgi:mannose-6-phosphate isomerase-like protein (cupin superfamily)